MKIKRQEERVIKKKEETEIPVENDTVLPFFGKRNGDGKPSGKATETGSSGNGMGGWVGKERNSMENGRVRAEDSPDRTAAL